MTKRTTASCSNTHAARPRRLPSRREQSLWDGSYVKHQYHRSARSALPTNYMLHRYKKGFSLLEGDIVELVFLRRFGHVATRALHYTLIPRLQMRRKFLSHGSTCNHARAARDLSKGNQYRQGWCKTGTLTTVVATC